MALNASKAPSGGGGPKADPIEVGNYVGRVVQVLDFGLQPQRPYQGKDKPPARELSITYELATEFLQDEEGNDRKDKPRWISEDFPLRHLSQDLAKSTKRAAALDGKGELEGDFAQMVGLPCTITVTQNPKKGDPTVIYNNVGNVTPPMKGFDVPELVNPPKVFDLDEPDLEVFGSLPEWLQKKIKGNLEYNGSILQRMLEGGEAKEPEPQQDEAPAEGGDGGEDPWEV